jgi:benzil reductase ((S)-benzoin forming)
MNLAIVTGHSRGVGAALAEKLLALDFTVFGIARHLNDALAGRYPDRLQQVALDLSDTAVLLHWLAGPTIARALQGASAVYLINNAGRLQPVGPLGTQNRAAIAQSVSLNVTAPMLLANAVVELTPRSVPCRILHISSGVGRRPCAGWSVYSATKAALDQHARSAALDAVPNLVVASVAPGVIDTDMQAEIRASDPARFPPLAQFEKLKRDGQLAAPAECADKLLAYLLSDRCKSGDVTDVREF